MDAVQAHRKRRAANQPPQQTVLFRNHRDAELADTLVSERHVNDAAAMVHHVIDALSANLLGRQAEKTVAIRRILVDQNDDPAVTDFFQTFFDGRDGHEAQK